MIEKTKNEIKYSVLDGHEIVKGVTDSRISTHFKTLRIANFKSAQDFEKIVNEVIQHNLVFENLILESNEFGGNVCCDALTKLIKKSAHIKSIEFNDKMFLSNSDIFRLNQYAQSISITYPNKELASYQPHDDNSLNLRKKKTIKFRDDMELTKHKNPPYGYFFVSSDKKPKFLPRQILRDFFSCYHQQRTDYTCGPASVVMIMDFFKNLIPGVRKNNKIFMDKIFEKLVSESELAKLMKTTEESGTEVFDMAEALEKLGIAVLHGLETDFFTTDCLLDKFELILDYGIPILVNYTIHMGTEKQEGHFGVLTAIENEQTVVLADPGARYEQDVHHETMSLKEFKRIWVDGSGVRGRYLIILPNLELKKVIGNLFYQENINAERKNFGK